jgi:Bacterial Ig domain/Purple acid Phosphatase, N-terminal domain
MLVQPLPTLARAMYLGWGRSVRCGRRAVALSLMLLTVTGTTGATATCNTTVVISGSLNPPPNVSVTAPSSGATVGGNVTLTATATSSTLVIAYVQFKVDGANIGSPIFSSPYTTTWNSTGVGDGAHTLSAVAEDTGGNLATSTITVTTRNSPPVISSISTTGSYTSATTTWTTDEAASSEVLYGLTTGYGSATSSAAFLTLHSIVLSGLTASSTYHYAIVSTDAEGNTATSSDQTFTTTPPPTISSIASTPNTTAATITWTTNQLANSEVLWGLTTSYGSASSSAPFVTSHSIILSGLATSTLYHFAIVSTDGGGLTSTSTDQTFSTTAISPPTVALTAPTASSTVSGSSVTLSATASDNIGVANVQFKVDGTNIGSAITSSPYTTTWNSTSTSNGTHTLYAVALNTSGLYATSSVSVTVINPPVISSISSGSPTNSSATITWATNENASSTVAYGTTTNYGSASSSPSFVTSHSITLVGLSPSTTYHYQVQSSDSLGNFASSSDQTFTTSSSAPAATCGISASPANITSGETSTLTWTSSNASSASLNQGIGSVATSSSQNVTPTITTTYTLSVNGSGGAGTCNATVTINTWQQLPIGAGGFISGMDIAPDNTTVVRTDTAGAFIWNGAEWQQLVTSSSMPAAFVDNAVSFNSGTYEIQIAPSDSSDMYMVYPVYEANTYPPVAGVYKSTNKGTTWTQTSFTPIETEASLNANGPYRMWGQKMAVNPTNPNNVYVGTGAQGLFETTDGGNTWSNVSGVPVATSTGGNCPGITGILFDPSNTSVIYVASYGNGIYQSTNGGTSWSKIDGSGGPTTVMFAAISTNGTDGTYFAIDSNGNLWVYAASTWTEPLSSGDVEGVAVDPDNQSHIVTVDQNGNLNESNNTGSTWGGWSANPTLVANDIPWLATLGGSYPVGLYFDQVVPDKLHANSEIGVWSTTLSGSIATSSPATWTDQSVGIEQVVPNEIIVPPVASSTPILASWDHAVFTSNLTSYPSIVGPIAGGNVVAGWSIDYASSNPNFIAVLADGTYAGGPQGSAYSTNDGQTWTLFPNLPYDTFGGNIAVSTPTNLIFADAGGAQPYYTTNSTSSTVTWNPITLPGVSSWSGFIGAYYDPTRVIAADRVLANTFYLYYPGYGVFKSTNGGASWTLVNNGSSFPAYAGTIQLEATPGEAGDLWMSFGTIGNPGGAPALTGLYHSTNGGTTWTAIPSIGAPA